MSKWDTLLKVKIQYLKYTWARQMVETDKLDRKTAGKHAGMTDDEAQAFADEPDRVDILIINSYDRST